MFNVITTFSFLNADGSQAKSAIVEEWSNLEKVKVVDQLEDRLMQFLLKLNALSTDIIKGKVKKDVTTAPLEVRLEALVTKNGKKWTRAVFEWPNMGEEQQAVMLGLFNGEMDTLDKTLSSHSKGKNK
jgi:hypothetical protein